MNPWYGPGIVTARDFTHDPAHGMDMNRVSAELVATRDRRIKYVIWNRRIIDSRPGNNPWVWAPYNGANPHDHHMHVSVMDNALCDDTTPWTLASFGSTPAPTSTQGMNAATLAAVMGNVAGVPYDQYLGPFVDGMLAAQCTTVNRAAMWCAQIGHESGGLRWMEEIADGSAYEGRKDLGNTQPGDGKRYKGRGPIQLTGAANYGAFSMWAHDQGLAPTTGYFVNNPTLVAQPRWGFLAASWYWTVARPKLNSYADAADILAATKAINGGTNGLADRSTRWARALKFGAALLPVEDDDMDARQDAMLIALYGQMAGPGADITVEGKQWTGWPSWDGGSGRALTPVDYLRQLDVQVTSLKTELETLKAAMAGLSARLAQP